MREINLNQIFYLTQKKQDAITFTCKSRIEESPVRDIPLVSGPKSVTSAECFTGKPISIHTLLPPVARGFHSAHPPGKKGCPHFTDEETETQRAKGPA